MASLFYGFTLCVGVLWILHSHLSGVEVAAACSYIKKLSTALLGGQYLDDLEKESSHEEDTSSEVSSFKLGWTSCYENSMPFIKTMRQVDETDPGLNRLLSRFILSGIHPATLCYVLFNAKIRTSWDKHFSVFTSFDLPTQYANSPPEPHRESCVSDPMSMTAALRSLGSISAADNSYTDCIFNIVKAPVTVSDRSFMTTMYC